MSTWRAVTVSAVVVAVGLALVGGLFLGNSLDKNAAARWPAEDSVDAGFSRDMQTHHAQAVQMSVLIRDRTDDPEINTLALDIILTQQQQAGQMFGWLTTWGLPQSTTSAPMAWMKTTVGRGQPDHSSMATPMSAESPMPGMASDHDLERLASLRGEAAERLYLQLMIPHHQGGVEMAQYATEQAQTPQVRQLSQSIVKSQAAEIRTLRAMLASRNR